MNSVPFVVLWSCLACAVLGLAIYRKLVSQYEDDSLHVLGDGSAVTRQIAFAHKLDIVDKWGKIFTIILLVSGLLMATIYLYTFWQDGSKLVS